MLLQRLTCGMLGANCYTVGDAGKAAVIDPCAPAKEITSVLEKLGMELECIILTHAHVDHILSMDELKSVTGAKVMAHEEDAELLSDPRLNGSMLFGLKNTFPQPDVFLKDGDTVEIGSLTMKVIHTPGHTPGSICLLAEDAVFTGDTLFNLAVGRTDLGCGSEEDLRKSLKEKLMALDDAIRVYPGHGTSTSIGYERAYNPFIV